VIELDVKLVEPDPNQPRKKFNIDSLKRACRQY